jgi:hypothetical protein
MHEAQLRPVERRIRKLADGGASDADIAHRFRKSPEFVRRVLQLASLPQRSPHEEPSSALRPIERRILRWRAAGAGHEEIADRFRRGPAFTQQIEDLARYKLDR